MMQRKTNRTRRMGLKFAGLGGLALVVSTILGWATPGQAAEVVVLKYRVLQRSISVEELSTFANTGVVSPGLQVYLDRSGNSPEEIRRTLTQPVEVNGNTLDRLLNTPLGNIAIDRVSRSIYTPSRRADRQAMRSALTLSATDDNRMTLMEVIEKYPTQEVYVDAENLAETYQDLIAVQQQIQRAGSILEDIFQ